MSHRNEQSGFADHFSQVAARYAGFRPGYPSTLFDYLATVADPAATVWDCAAGNGQATAGLAKRFAHVIATDASREQIAAATPLPHAEFRVALAEQSGLTDASIGLVTVAQALHWFDLPRFYAEVQRVLVPGGVLAVWCYGINQVEGDAVNELVQEYYSRTLDPYWPPSRRWVEAGYRTLPFPYAEMVPPTMEMVEHWTLEELLGYYSTWSATNQFIRANRENPLEPLREKLRPIWGDAGRSRRVTWPVSLRLGRKSASRI